VVFLVFFRDMLIRDPSHSEVVFFVLVIVQCLDWLEWNHGRVFVVCFTALWRACFTWFLLVWRLTGEL